MLVEFCLPVFNEEKILKENGKIFYDFCRAGNFSFDWRVVLLNNGSDDDSERLARELERQFPDKIFLENTAVRGKGGAIKKYFLKSRAEVLVYLDIDLAVSLDNLPELIGPVLAGECDLAFGSRLLPASRVSRPFLRTLSSVSYNFLSRLILGLGYRDLQCGFKAMNRRVVAEVLPLIRDNDWFFDTELIALADRRSLKIKEIPADWSENRYDKRKSKINLFKDGLVFMGKLIKLRLAYGGK
ncbi:MAG: glycosyltransferase [bacterium]|nr:glycosyltransferase [bacterium]